MRWTLFKWHEILLWQAEHSLLHREEEAAWRKSVCRFPPVAIRRLIHQPLDSFCPSRGRVGTPLRLTLSISDATTGTRYTEGSAGKNKGEGLENEALWSDLCIRQHCCMKRKKRGGRGYSIIVMSDFHYMYVQVWRDGVGREVKCGNIAVCWKGGWCDGATENKRGGKASSFCILWLFVVNEWTVSRCIVSEFHLVKMVAGGETDSLSGPPVRLYGSNSVCHIDLVNTT